MSGRKRRGRIPGFTLKDGGGRGIWGFLNAMYPQPDNPEAYETAFWLTQKKFKKEFQDAAQKIVNAVYRGDEFFPADVARYVKIIRDTVDQGNPIDFIGAWIWSQYETHGEDWTPRVSELQDLSTRVWSGGLGEATIKRRCERMGLPLSKERGRPKNK